MKREFSICLLLLIALAANPQVYRPIDEYENYVRKRSKKKVEAPNDTLFKLKAFFPGNMSNRYIKNGWLEFIRYDGVQRFYDIGDTLIQITSFGSYFLFDVDTTVKVAKIKLYNDLKLPDYISSLKDSSSYQDPSEWLNNPVAIFSCKYIKDKKYMIIDFKCECPTFRNKKLKFYLSFLFDRNNETNYYWPPSNSRFKPYEYILTFTSKNNPISEFYNKINGDRKDYSKWRKTTYIISNY